METIEINKILTKEHIKKTINVLVDNGIEPDEAGIVLQAIGYTLLDTELETLINSLEGELK